MTNTTDTIGERNPETRVFVFASVQPPAGVTSGTLYTSHVIILRRSTPKTQKLPKFYYIQNKVLIF